MKKNREKIINLQEYKKKKKEIEINRDELLKLIREVITTK